MTVVLIVLSFDAEEDIVVLGDALSLRLYAPIEVLLLTGLRRV